MFFKDYKVVSCIIFYYQMFKSQPVKTFNTSLNFDVLWLCYAYAEHFAASRTRLEIKKNLFSGLRQKHAL